MASRSSCATPSDSLLCSSQDSACKATPRHRLESICCGETLCAVVDDERALSISCFLAFLSGNGINTWLLNLDQKGSSIFLGWLVTPMMIIRSGVDSIAD